MNLPIHPLAPPPPSLLLSGRVVDTLALKPGQLIEAEVIRGGADQQVTIKINGQLITLRSERPLQAGQHYTFRVQFAQGQWQLIPQTATNPATAASPLTSLLTPSAHPVTTPLTQLLQQLPLQALPASLQPLIQQLRQQLLTPERLTGAQLEKTVHSSGLFFEHRTLKNRTPPQDLKAILLKLLAQAQQTDKPLIEPIRAMLRHIEHHQARTLIEHHLVIPLLFAPDSGIRQGTLIIEPDAHRHSNHERSAHWRALLELEFEQEGTLQLSVILHHHTLTLEAWSDNPLWHAQLQQRFSALQAWMAQAGFSVKTLRWQDTPLIQPATPGVSIRA